ESLVHFLGAVAVAAYLRTPLANVELNRLLLLRLSKEAWSTGDLFDVLASTVRLAGDCDGLLPYPELPGFLFGPRGAPTASHAVLQGFVTLRNREWGHGTGRDEGQFERL